MSLNIQGVSWELIKSISFVLEPGGLTGDKNMEDKIQFSEKFKTFYIWNIVCHPSYLQGWHLAQTRSLQGVPQYFRHFVFFLSNFSASLTAWIKSKTNMWRQMEIKIKTFQQYLNKWYLWMMEGPYGSLCVLMYTAVKMNIISKLFLKF